MHSKHELLKDKYFVLGFFYLWNLALRLVCNNATSQWINNSLLVSPISTKELMLLNCDAGEDSLESPWTGRKSNQSILKEINPEYLLEGLMLKLKLQYFDHLKWRADSLEKTLIWGKIEGRRRRSNRAQRWWMASPIQRKGVWTNSGRWWRPGQHAAVHRSQRFWHYRTTEQ